MSNFTYLQHQVRGLVSRVGGVYQYISSQFSPPGGIHRSCRESRKQLS